MFPSLPFSLSLLTISICTASAIHRITETGQDAPLQERAQPILTSSSQSLFNTSSLESLTVTNSSSGESTLVSTDLRYNLGVKCDAREYGGGLNAASCFNALRQSPTGAVQESWGRRVYTPQVDVELPIRLFSGECASGFTRFGNFNSCLADADMSPVDAD